MKEGTETISKEDLKDFSDALNEMVFDVLGLIDENSSSNANNKLDDVMHLLINLRKQARENKDFAMSDQIRDELLAIGIQLKDGKEATIFSIQ